MNIAKVIWRYWLKIYRGIRNDEIHLCCGTKNRDIIFYVIRPSSSAQRVGLMSIHNYVLRKIEYALEHKYIPVIDYKHYKCLYSDPKMRGNVWEYYYKQPTSYSLKDCYKSRHVILCGGE